MVNEKCTLTEIHLQLHHDEELLRAIREKSQLTEEQAFELGEEVKHTIWSKLKGTFVEHG